MTRVKLFKLGACLLGGYVAAAYLVIPRAWERYAQGRPSFDHNPRITVTGDGHPGDPLNVALVGDAADVAAAMRRAKWREAAALGVRSDLEIAGDTILDRPDANAPVSNLYLFGRKEDLAFERPVGDSPRQRHHVRLWRTERTDGGRSIWVGAATFDESVGISHTTGQITHHIAGDIDAERNFLIESLDDAGTLESDYVVEGFHAQTSGVNGGGDRWETDGGLGVAVVAPLR